MLHCRFYGTLTECDSEHFSTACRDSNIHIYKIHIPKFTAVVEALSYYLEAQEKDRAQRFYKEQDKNRFIISRALLKLVLANHSQSAVSKIILAYHENKKPYLPSHPALHFNVTHSEDYALIAIANSAIGVDIEYIAKNDALINTVTHIFNKQEVAFIQEALDTHYAFYTLWTRKEAFVKALGKGIDDDITKIPSIDGFHSLDPTITNNTVNTWQLEGFDINEHYVGAVAYQTPSAISKNIILSVLPNNITDLLALSSS